MENALDILYGEKNAFSFFPFAKLEKISNPNMLFRFVTSLTELGSGSLEDRIIFAQPCFTSFDAVAGFTQAGEPSLDFMTSLNPSLQTTSFASIPDLNCFNGGSIGVMSSVSATSRVTTYSEESLS